MADDEKKETPITLGAEDSVDPNLGVEEGETLATPNPPRHKRRKPRSSTGSTLVIAPGHAEIKGYSVTRDELWLLGSLGAGTTAAFSAASALIGYYVNTGVSLALSQGISEKIVSSYETSRSWSLGVAIGLYFVGAGLAATGSLKVFSILRRTTHDD